MIKLEFACECTLGTVLIIGAHCDDIEIGMGATVLKLVENNPNAQFVWVTLSSDNVRKNETQVAAERLMAKAKTKQIIIKSFRGSYFPYVGDEIKGFFETLKDQYIPDIIFTHYRQDLHQDHRITNELTWNTFRDHFILEYEIPKYDGDMGTPNFFVPLSRNDLQRKIDILMECFPSQLGRNWFTRETFEAVARFRGIESNAPEGVAEGFYCRKGILNFKYNSID